MAISKFVVILSALLVAGSCLNYCEVENPSATLFTTSQEIQQIPLDRHIRGYNLNFQSSDETLVHVFEPYHVAARADVTIKAGYTVVNIDGRNSNSHLWTREGILFAQGAGSNIAIGYGQFTNAVLPEVKNFSYFELPFASNCYSGLIFNSNLDVVVDCEGSTAVADQRRDLSCVVTRAGKLTCNSFGSVTKTAQRKSVIYNIGQERFLLSAALTQNVASGFQNETFINIFHIVQDRVEFNLIIDRRTLGLDSLSITDLDIIQVEGRDYIAVSDTASRIILFRYTEANMVEDIRVVSAEGKVQQLAVTTEGTYLVVTQKQIVEAGFDSASSQLLPIRRYELDQTDSLVTDIQSSYLFLSVRTSNNRLYTYDRRYTQLRYLLNREELSASTAIVVSPFYPRLFHINSTSMVSVSISSGYLLVSQVQESKDVVITATSMDNAKCQINIRLEFVQDDSKVFQKKVLSSAYRLESNVDSRFVLTDYFGGKNLNYDVKADKPDLKLNVQHVTSYTQKLPAMQDGETVIYEKIVEYDSSTYWLARFTELNLYLYACKAGANREVQCTLQDKNQLGIGSMSICDVDGLRRSNDQAILYWAYCSTPRVDSKILTENKGFRSTTFLEYARFTDVTVGQRYAIILEKELNRFTIMEDLKVGVFTFKQFTQAQLDEMGGFYPRQVFFSQKNPSIFYAKFPTTVVTFYYRGGQQLEVLSIFKVSDQYIPEDQWQLAVGKETIFLMTPAEVAQYAVLADGTVQKLHSITLDKTPTGRIKYEPSTDTVYLQYTDNSIQYIRLNQAAIDSQYYRLGSAQLNSDSWDVSGSWLKNADGKIYYQYQEPALVILSNLPSGSYREEIMLKVKVSNEMESKQVTANVTALDYPIIISASSASDNGLVLPENGNNQTILFSIDNYFTGSVATYNISCPYCQDGNIELITPINRISENKELGRFSAIVGLEDNTGALVLVGKKINWVDLKNVVQLTQQIPSEGDCLSMGLNLGNLIVLCSSTSSQQFYLFSVVTGASPSITLVNHYQVPAQGVIYKPSQIGVFKMSDSTLVLVHDFDPMSPGLKDSTIKVFQLADAISFKTQIDSTVFNTAKLEPLNSMSLYKQHLLVTIGSIGVGYINLNVMDSPQLINFENQEQLRNYTLDDTQYLRASIYGKGTTETALQALFTTSNSLNYVISFTLAGNILTLSKVEQTYNRYGHQTALNWGLIDEKFVMLSYYNKTTSVESIVLYKRASKAINEFYTSKQFTIPLTQLRLPKAALLHTPNSEKTSLMFLDQADMPASAAALSLFNVTQQFHLLAKYSQPSSFDTIKVTAMNDYNSVSRDLSVQFENSSGGLKWYSVVIVLTLVLIAVGVAAGLYLKMKKKKADSKKVSLFTENEEIDETI